jgi:hypothetical protein
MAFNRSKARDPRAWAKVRKSGGVGTIATAQQPKRKPVQKPIDKKLLENPEILKMFKEMKNNSKIIYFEPKKTKKFPKLSKVELARLKQSLANPAKPLTVTQRKMLEERLRTDQQFRRRYIDAIRAMQKR